MAKTSIALIHQYYPIPSAATESSVCRLTTFKTNCLQPNPQNIPTHLCRRNPARPSRPSITHSQDLPLGKKYIASYRSYNRKELEFNYYFESKHCPSCRFVEEPSSTSPELTRSMIRNTVTKCLPSLEKLKVPETVSKRRFQTFPMSPSACIAFPERSTNSLVANSVPKQPTTRIPTVPLSTVHTPTIRFKSWFIGTSKDLSFVPPADWYVLFLFLVLSLDLFSVFELDLIWFPRQRAWPLNEDITSKYC